MEGSVMADIFDQIHAQANPTIPTGGGRGGGRGGGPMQATVATGGRGGGFTSPPAQPTGDVVGQSHAGQQQTNVQPKTGFGGRLLQNLNPVPLIDAMVHRPIDTVKNIVWPADQPAQEAADAWKQGDYGTAAERTLEDVPLVGPLIRQTRQDVT